MCEAEEEEDMGDAESREKALHLFIQQRAGKTWIRVLLRGKQSKEL